VSDGGNAGSKGGRTMKYCLVSNPRARGSAQRQETLDLPYLTLLCDNLKNRMFLQNFFPDPILGICYVVPVIHIIPLFHSQTITLWTVE
jgi:hypothetical protein